MKTYFAVIEFELLPVNHPLLEVSVMFSGSVLTVPLN